MAIWSIIEGPLNSLVVGLVLGYAALALLGDYRKAFKADPKAAMSVDVIMLAITSSGGPGYLAAFLLAGSILCFISTVFAFLFNVSSYLGFLR
jgi:hypothetical protein